MMKQIATLLLILSVCLNTRLVAQARYGLKAGLSLVNVHYSGTDDPYFANAVYQKNSDPLPFFFVGGIAELDWQKNLTLSGELQVSGKGYSLFTPDVSSDYTNYKVRLWYVQVPLNINIRWNGFFGGLGPYAALVVAGSTKSDLRDPKTNTVILEDNFTPTFGNAGDKYYRRFEFGAQAQAGYSFRNVRVVLSYALGLTSVIPSAFGSDATARNRMIGASAVYIFGVGE